MSNQVEGLISYVEGLLVNYSSFLVNYSSFLVKKAAPRESFLKNGRRGCYGKGLNPKFMGFLIRIEIFSSIVISLDFDKKKLD